MSETQVFRFDDVEVDRARACVTQAGRELHLRQKSFQVLVHLIESRERLVSKTELFDVVWKDTAVTDDVLVQCIKEIRRAIGDDPHKPRFIRTVPKAGYRFIGDVEPAANGSYAEEITHVEFEYEEHDDAPPAPGLKTATLALAFARVRSYAFAGVALVLAVGLAAAYFWPSRSRAGIEEFGPRTDGRKVVAVLAFENVSGDAELDWLSSGLPDMLTTGLSRSEKLAVLDRDRFSSLPGKLPDALDEARRRHIDVLVTGSFARLGDRIRVDAQLVETNGGSVIASETLTSDKSEQVLSDIDLLSIRIAKKITTPSETQQAETSSVLTYNLEAFRYYTLGVEKIRRFETMGGIELLEKAVAIDPNFAMANARIGYAYAVTSAQVEKGKPYLEKAFRASSRLTDKDRMSIAAWYAIAHQDFPGAIKAYREIIDRFPLEIEAYYWLSKILSGEDRVDESIDAARQGISVDPESKELYNRLGSTLSRSGRHAEAIAAHERYVALAPDEPNAYDSLGGSLLWAGEHQRAVENFERAVDINPEFDVGLIHLANARIRLGQYSTALDVLRRYLAAAPSNVEKSRGHDAIAFIQSRKGDLAAAERSATESTKISPNQNLWRLYEIAVRRGDKGRAATFERRLNGRYIGRGAPPSLRFDYYFKGSAALNAGRVDEALENFREAIRRQPPTWHFEDFEDCLGNAYLHLGQYDNAIAEYQRVLQLSPNYPLAHYSLARAYEGKGLAEEARNSYLAFLDAWKDADPDIPEVVAARRAVGA